MHRATIEQGMITFEQINNVCLLKLICTKSAPYLQMERSQIALLKNQPLYFIERKRTWIVHQYHEKFNETRGDEFNIAGIQFINQFEQHYHRSIIFAMHLPVKDTVQRSVISIPLYSDSLYRESERESCENRRVTCSSR